MERSDVAPPLRILLISGSTRQPSYTMTLADSVERTLSHCRATTMRWDLRDQPLPVADPRYHHDPAQHPDEVVRSLVAFASGADAFVLASPIYHNSFSGVLKNALDHLAIAQFHYKPVGLISHGGHRSTQAVDQLRIVVRGLLGQAITTQICTAQTDFRETGDGYELVSNEIQQRIERFAIELAVFAFHLAPLRQQELRR